MAELKIETRGTRGGDFGLVVTACSLVCIFGTLVGCSPVSEKSEPINLISDRTPVEFQWEEASVDFATWGARRHLAAGWNPPSYEQPRIFTWSRGEQSEIEFDLVAARDLDFVLNCRALPARGMPPQEIALLIGDDEVGRIFPGQNFAEFSVRLPREKLRAGRNSIVLRYAWARSPKSLGDSKDWRRLAIAVKEFKIRGAHQSTSPTVDGNDSLTLPPGSAVQWALSVNSGASLLGQWMDDRSADGTIVVSLVQDIGTEFEITRWSVGDRLSIRFPEEIRGPARLTLRHLPGEASNGPLVLQSLVLNNPKSTHAVEGSPQQSTALFHGPDKTDRFNVVIYLVDALRADHLGVYGYQRDVSPRVDAFAEESLVFDQAWANSSWTRPAVASILTGLRPEVHKTNRRDDRLPLEIKTLPEMLHSNGYRTAAVIVNPNISGIFGFDRGFDEFTLLPTETSRARHVYEAASLWLSDRRDQSEPFFLYLHTVDPHHPYNPPDEQREIFAAQVERRDLGSTEVMGTLQARHLVDEADYVDDLVDLYDAEIAANDKQFGRLLDHIEDLGLSDQTLVVFLADHGEEFFDHGGWIHGHTLYSEVLRIPLIIRVPGSGSVGRTALPVQQADLTPTILGLLGLSIPPDLQGRDLGSGTLSRISLGAFLDLDGAFGRSVIDEKWHAIQHGSHGYLGQPEIYDVVSDPTESSDGYPEQSARPGLMLGEDRDSTRPIEGRFNASDAEVDEETQEQLEALGYL